MFSQPALPAQIGAPGDPVVNSGDIFMKHHDALIIATFSLTHSDRKYVPISIRICAAAKIILRNLLSNTEAVMIRQYTDWPILARLHGLRDGWPLRCLIDQASLWRPFHVTIRFDGIDTKNPRATPAHAHRRALLPSSRDCVYGAGKEEIEAVRVVVAMSGGVDSSVTAGLLHEAGHEVIGVTLQLYDHGQAAGRKGACCAGQDIHDARDVAARLGIPHYVIDAEARFKDAVIARFADAYAAGETPVPCIACNQSVKFTDLLALSQDLGAEALATGHYVRRLDGPAGPELHQAEDASRDQSWFLFATTAAQLAYCRFPLGGMPDKATVRAHAARLGLATAEKPDSQDICFVPTGSYAGIVTALRPDAGLAGDIVTGAGEVVGRHDGIAHYTVGQGKRLGSAAMHHGQQMAVLALDASTRRVIVGPRTHGLRRFTLRDVNWLIAQPEGARTCQVKLRAHEARRDATIMASANGTAVTLTADALPAPGQACVFYDGSRVLGGGFIQAGASALAA
jgi:tRNA-specific 2-thiouridylase